MGRSDGLSLKPVFVIGMPRSGTSLMSQILDSHPQIIMSPTLDFLQWRLQEINTVEEKAEDLQLDGTAFAASAAIYIEELLSRYAASRIARTGRQTPTRVGSKLMAWNPRSLKGMESFWDDVVWVLITRNCTDMFASLMNQSWGCKDWKLVVKTWIAYHQSVFSAKLQKLVVVRYEELVKDPAGILPMVTAACDLEWSEKVLWPERYQHDDLKDLRTKSKLMLGVDSISPLSIGRAEGDLPSSVYFAMKEQTDGVIDKLLEENYAGV